MRTSDSEEGAGPHDTTRYRRRRRQSVNPRVFSLCTRQIVCIFIRGELYDKHAFALGYAHLGKHGNKTYPLGDQATEMSRV